MTDSPLPMTPGTPPPSPAAAAAPRRPRVSFRLVLLLTMVALLALTTFVLTASTLHYMRANNEALARRLFEEVALRVEDHLETTFGGIETIARSFAAEAAALLAPSPTSAAAGSTPSARTPPSPTSRSASTTPATCSTSTRTASAA